MKRLIIADVKSNNRKGKCTGHYFAVAQNYFDLYNERIEVKIAGGPIFATHFPKEDCLLLPYDFKFSKNWLLDKWKVLKNCRYLFQHTSSDDVVVIQQSGLSTAILGIALYASKRHNVYVIAYDDDAVRSCIKRVIYNWAKPKMKGLLCPYKSIAEAYGISHCIVTDYIYAGKGREERISFENKKYDVAIVGSIWPDKGVLEAAERLATTRYRVLIAGRGDETIISRLREISSASSNIELKVGFVDEKDYADYIRSSRYCMLNYRGVYEERSSGVVLDLIFNGTPILGHRCKALQFVEDAHLGVLFDKVEDFDFSCMEDPTLFNSFQEGIAKYIEEQQGFKQKAIEYLGI